MSRVRAIVYSVVLAAVSVVPARSATFALSVSTFGPVSDSVVVSSPAGIDCGGAFTACSSTFTAGSTVTLLQATSSTMAFAGWGGADGCPTTEQTCAILVDSAKFVEATFDPLLSLRLSGDGLGVVTSSSGGVNCAYTNSCASGATGTWRFKQGATVELYATAATSSTFTGWSGIGGCATSSTCTFTMNGYTVGVATFSSTGPFEIAVTKGGTGGGTVTSSPPGIDCGDTCSASFSSGTVVTLSAAPDDDSRFVRWANGGCASTSTCVVVSSSAQQGLGGAATPTAFFYP